MPKKKQSMRQAALGVYAGNRNRPLKVKALWEQMIAGGYEPGPKAKTPIATLSALLSTKKEVFEKTAPGTYRATTAALKKHKAEQAAEE